MESPRHSPQHSIVAGVDFTEHSRAALREAARLAASMQRRLEVVTVIPDHAMEAMLEGEHASRHEILKTAAENLEVWCRSELPGELRQTPLEARAEAGDPFEELAAKTDASADALLVLGSRGTRAEQGHAGGVASRCVRRAESPVLLVRRDHLEPFRRVLVGYDWTKGARAALELAATIARCDGAELVVAHVRQPVILPDGLGLSSWQPELEISEAQRPLVERDLEDELAKTAIVLPDHVRVRGLINPNPEAALAALAGELDADLLALGTHGRRGWRRLLLGTTAEHLIHESPCSVLAVKG